ncbi:MAG: hypothetical protein WD294_10265 [Phycisphaeraceae bacterium]
MATANRLHAVCAAGLIAIVGATASSSQAVEQDDDHRNIAPDAASFTPDLWGNGDQDEGAWGNAKLFDPSIGFDLPTRAEQYARSWEQLTNMRRFVRDLYGQRLRAKRRQEDLLETSPEMQEARQEVRQAYEDVQQLEREIRQQLQDEPLYASTAERARELAVMIEMAHRREDVSRYDLIELAERQLYYRERLADLRQELVDTQALEQARQELAEAGNRLEELKAQARRAVQQADEVVEARQEHQRAKRALAHLEAEYAAARAAYWEADYRQVAQNRIRRLRPVYDPYWGRGWWW